MTTIIICLSAIVCVGFVCASFIHVHTKELEDLCAKDIEEKIRIVSESCAIRFNVIENKLTDIGILAEEAKKQLTAHNVAQGFKIGK